MEYPSRARRGNPALESDIRHMAVCKRQRHHVGGSAGRQMSDELRLVQVVSHVTSFVGRVGVIGLCSCGWLTGEEGEDTRLAVLRLNQAWEAHDRGEAPPNRASWPLPPAAS
jgi:hypothetical protein